MGGGSLSFLGQQLLNQAPLLLAYALGIVLPLVFWGRCPGPSLMTLLASVVLLLTTLVTAGVQTYLLSARLDWSWDNATYARALSALYLAGSVVRGLAVGVIVAAVFVGRKRRPAYPDERPWPDDRA